jgi:hypothetical protein
MLERAESPNKWLFIPAPATTTSDDDDDVLVADCIVQTEVPYRGSSRGWTGKEYAAR